MAPTLYLHPLASFCHKVLIAFYENEVAFQPVTVDLQDPGEAAALMARWPVGEDPGAPRHGARPCRRGDQHHHRIRPAALSQARSRCCRMTRNRRSTPGLWDRAFDLYVATPMQKVVVDRIRPKGRPGSLRRRRGARALDTAYAMIDAQLAGKDWAAGDRFTIADCAACPALFYASIVHPLRPRGTPAPRRLFRAAVGPTVDAAHAARGAALLHDVPVSRGHAGRFLRD